MLSRMVNRVWRLKGMPDSIDEDVTRAFANAFMSAVSEGYGNTLAGIAYDTPDYNMLLSLQRNVYHFSAAKNYQQLKALTEALVKEDGTLRTRREFREAAAAINNKFCGVWLDTERNTAIGSAQMASIWVDIQANKDTLNIIEWDVVLDGRTTVICRPLAGVRKHVDDPFTQMYFPPNHFLCRTTVRRHAGGAVTKDSDTVHPEIPAMFRTNFAAQGVVFPPEHPYFTGTPADVLATGTGLIE